MGDLFSDLGLTTFIVPLIIHQMQLVTLLLFFRHLSVEWGLDLKDESASVLACSGADLSDFRADFEMPLVEEAHVLGWLISSNNSFDPQWRELVARSWGIFLSNTRQRGWRQLGVRRRLALLDRCVRPYVLYKLQICGPTAHWSGKVRKLQRHLVGRALNLSKLSVEDWEEFMRRVAREARAHVGVSISDWTKIWIKQTLSWDSHLSRDFSEQQRFWEDKGFSWNIFGDPCDSRQVIYCTRFSWAASLSRFHAEEWLQSRRTFELRNRFQDSWTSRTSTRVVKGRVTTRWHDSVSWCKSLG